jgi:hypothetical protein
MVHSAYTDECDNKRIKKGRKNITARFQRSFLISSTASSIFIPQQHLSYGAERISHKLKAG